LRYKEKARENKKKNKERICEHFVLFIKTIKYREKHKISPCGLPDLQFTPCGIKTNLKVLWYTKENNLVPTVKFHPLT
jgi:hypothetical protein